MFRTLLPIISFLLSFVFINAQVIPEDSIIPVCDNQSISVGAPENTGIYDLTIPCNLGQPLSPFMDFYYLKILSGTTFAFTVTPIGQDDYDFGAWKNPDWNNIANTPQANKRGSQNDPFQTGVFILGLSLTATDLCETGGSSGLPEPGMVRYFDVQAGDEILIAIDRWSSTTDGYTIEFGGNAILDCTVIGDSYGKCDEDNSNTEQFVAADFLPDLQQEYPNNNFEFYYTQADAEANNTNYINFPLTVNYNGGDPTEIFVRVETTSGAFVRIIKLFLLVNKLPELITDEVDLPVQCNDGNDQAVFDLTQSQPLFAAIPGLYTFKYYTTLAAANAGGNDNIANPGAYQSGTATVFARIQTGAQQGNEDGCFTVGEINLKVSEFNVAEQTLTFNDICDDDGDGFVIVDLTENITDIVANPAGYQISYHTTALDAQNGSNPIANPTTYSIAAPASLTIYVRIHSLTDPCFSVSTLVYNTVERPVLNVLDDVSICDNAQNGNVSYDLTQFAALIVNNPGNYTISYYNSLANAENGSNPIANPAAYQIPVNSTVTIYIRVEATGCFNIGSVNIKITSNPLVTDLPDQAFCTDQQSGTIFYDLTQHQSEWVTNPASFDFEYYPTMNDLQNGTNLIANPANYEIQVGQTTHVFVKIISPLSDCFATTELILYPGSAATLNQGVTVTLCDDDFDGIFNYNLNQLNPQLIANTSGLTFSYYLSEQNAIDDQNAIPQAQWSNYQFNNLPAQIWVVATTADLCRSVPVVVSFEAGEGIVLNQTVIGPIGYCQGDLIDLTIYETQITNENATFSFHSSLSDAQNDLNPIFNTTNYEPQGNNSVFVRVEMNGRCPEIAEIKFKLNPTPDIQINQSLVELCPGDSFVAIASSSDPNPVFEWYLNDVLVGTGEEFEITENGNYTIIVTGQQGCSNQTTMQVVSPSAPQITEIEIGQNYIIIGAVAGGGGGVLEYSLDQVFWQSSPRFDNLVPGETYTVYVRQGGCMIASYTVALVYISNFISPNDDGINDTWEIRGIEVTPNATLKIFDRYGKIFVDTNFGGNYIWKGKYMGANVASTDYWYIINIPGDGVVLDRKFVGHISLRNQ